MFHKVMKLNICKIFFQNMYQTCCYSAKVGIKEDTFRFFKHDLDIPEYKIKNIFKNCPSFYNDSYDSLYAKLSQLKIHGISKEDIINKIQILSCHPLTIKNRVMILEEGGFIKSKIDAKTIYSIRALLRKSIKSLKNESYIYEHTNVEVNILSFIQFPKELYPKYCNESREWNKVVQDIFKLYIEWRVKMNSENIQNAINIYKRFNNKSFRLVERSIDILQHELNFSDEMFRRHPYVIYSDPDNTRVILEKFQNLCGMDAKILLRKHPKIILTPWKTIELIIKHFEDFGVPQSKLAVAPGIFTLGSDSVYKRLCKLKETPVLASFIPHPYMAKLIFYSKKVNSRLKYLQSMNCVSLNLLITDDKSFKRFMFNNHNKGNIRDIMIYLTNEFHQNKNNLSSHFKRHPHWRYIPLLTIRKTCEFLKKKNFTEDQLYHCLQILLYPVHTIQEALDITQNMDNVSYLRDFSGSIKSEYILPLVLYNIEKNYHFNGNGVWHVNKIDKTMLLTDSSNIPIEDREELNHNPLLKYL